MLDVDRISSKICLQEIQFFKKSDQLMIGRLMSITKQQIPQMSKQFDTNTNLSTTQTPNFQGPTPTKGQNVIFNIHFKQVKTLLLQIK